MILRSNTGSAASLSARRAWIEMQAATILGEAVESLSARRAWIEIGAATYTLTCRLVALRKESVDRNKPITCVGSDPNSRSPQGERG